MKKLKGNIFKVSSISNSQRERMFELMDMYFENMVKTYFDKDLEEKEYVILLKDYNGQVQGFSTIMLLDEIVEDIPIKAVFSGDTIIHKDYWGEKELMRVFGGFVLSLIQKYNNTKLYWFLISMGYKTYRFLPVFFKEFYPRYDKPIPYFEKKVLDALGYKKYPLKYNPDTGIIHFNGVKEYLRDNVADITKHRLKNPHIAFFVKRNPLYTKGDELACIAELSTKNLKPVAHKIIALEE